MEKGRRGSREDVEKYDLEILMRRPSLRTTIPRRVSQIRRDDIATEETNCGAGCIRGQWLQSFANRHSFILVYGILGSFYGSYYAYFYGVISTLERLFKISSQTIGLIAAAGDITQVVMCFILSQCVPKIHRPKWIGIGILLIVTSTVIFTLPHFLCELEFKNMSATQSTYQTNDSFSPCVEGSAPCTTNLGEERKMSIIMPISAQILHGIGGSLYFIMGNSYLDDNTEKYKPPPLLSLLSVLKILGPSFGYWLSSISLKIPQHPKLMPNFTEDDSHWIGAWWLGSLVIGFILLVPGLLVTFFPTTLPKAAIKRLNKQLKATSESDRNEDKKGKTSMVKKLFINPTTTHFAALFNIVGFTGYFIFLPKYVEIQYRVTASNANLIAGSATLISSAVGIVTANSVISRYRPSARALASWSVIVGLLTVGGPASYIFLDCQANDHETKLMVTQQFEETCKCANSSFSPVCDEDNRAFISFCHAGCKNITDINKTQICNQTEFISKARKVFKGFCSVDCQSTFVKFIIVTCSMTFIYATGRTSIHWFETKSEEKQHKSATATFGLILGFLASTPVPIVFGYLLDQTCLLWDGNCKRSGNCWLYDNEKMRLNMNLTAIGFALIGIFFDVGIWFSMKNVALFDDADYQMDEIDEN